MALAASVAIAAPAEAKQRGLASFYGPGFHNKLMANGKRFDQWNPRTVAHKTLPLGTLVEIKTKPLPHSHTKPRRLIATVTDRGPYKRGRIVDLSVRGAEKLGIIKQGTAMVDVTVLKRGKGS